MPTLSFDLHGLDLLSHHLQQSLTARLATGVQAQTEAVRQAWLHKVQEAGRQKYTVYEQALASPGAVEYPVNGDPLHGRVVISNNTRVYGLEFGGPRRERKPSWLAGAKSRAVKPRSKSGSWIYPAQDGAPCMADVVKDQHSDVARALSREVRAWQR